MSDFDDLIPTHDLNERERERLQRVHELLVQAGPPPELPPELRRPAGERRADVIQFPLPLRRRVGAIAVVAAAVAALAFGGGFLLGHSKAKTEAFAAKHVVPMTGISGSRAQIEIGSADAAGNWPMLVSLVGLPQQRERGSYYELWLSRHGKPAAPCGTFRVSGRTTTLRLTVPYRLRSYDGWVVTAVRAGTPDPGQVVMRTPA